jgi:hypothetical protein
MIPWLRARARVGRTRRKERRDEKKATYSHRNPSWANQLLTGNRKRRRTARTADR